MGKNKKKKVIKTKTVYAFIDSQNLNLGVRSAGWKTKSWIYFGF